MPSAESSRLGQCKSPKQLRLRSINRITVDYTHYERREAATETTPVTDITARSPRDIGQFARNCAEAFK